MKGKRGTLIRGGDKELSKRRGVLRRPVLVVDRLCEPAGRYIVGGFYKGEGDTDEEESFTGLLR